MLSEYIVIMIFHIYYGARIYDEPTIIVHKFSGEWKTLYEWTEFLDSIGRNDNAPARITSDDSLTYCYKNSSSWGIYQPHCKKL